MKNRKLKYSLNDPMVLLLSYLLAFLTLGNLFSGCFAKKVTYSVELDAAFGGDNTGYTGLINESSVSEKTVNALEALLLKDERFNVMRTHASGTPMAVADSAAKINEDRPQIVLSIHAGWNPNGNMSGTRVYPDLKDHSGYAESSKLAGLVQKAFDAEDWKASLNQMYMHEQSDGTFRVEVIGIDETPADTGGTRAPTWTILEKTEVPCVVVEQFFVSSRADVEKWNSDEGYRLIAEKYYSVLCEYFGIEEKQFEEETPQTEQPEDNG